MPQTLLAVAISLAISVALSVVLPLLFPKQQQQPAARPQEPAIPKPSDGKYNQKQSVPSLAIILGRAKKGSDYDLLEEKAGTAYHLLVPAAHEVEGFVAHYLHDEQVTLDGDGYVTDPAHFGSKVRIRAKTGPNVETAWDTLVSIFSDIWTLDHRGDGLAQVLMECQTVDQNSYTDVYPQQMPVHTAIIDGAKVYDPRDDGQDPEDPSTWLFTRNLALLRLHHLTQPWGYKRQLSDMYMPEWAAAADICDELVLNRDSEHEPRYAGGLWFREENDPVDVGLKLDQAAELVIYERPDGTVGVHPGTFVEPDITIGVSNILEFHYDANRRAATTVLAVRGRFTDPGALYNTVDAAIWGDPYTGSDDTQRSQTVDVEAVQSHNHCQRLQKLAYIRANAPHVSLTIPYLADSPTRQVSYRRFVRINYPDRGLDNAVVEILGRPKLSLKNLTITFEGIVVPDTLYDFDGPTEEGTPGAEIVPVVGSGVPIPTGLEITIAQVSIAGGETAAVAIAEWDHVSDALLYELEWQPSDASTASQSSVSKSGDTELRSNFLADSVEYQFRLRAWSGGAPSPWTDYVIATAVADTTAPGQPTGFGSAKVGSNVTLSWTNPNSANLYETRVYRGTTSTFGSAVQIFSSKRGAGEARSYVDSGLAVGTYYWWVKSFNASDIGSTEVGPETKTI